MVVSVSGLAGVGVVKGVVLVCSTVIANAVILTRNMAVKNVTAKENRNKNVTPKPVPVSIY